MAFHDLQISFFLYMRKRFYSERQIAEQLLYIKEIANSTDYYLPTMDGAISILYNGEELLGETFWDEIFTVHINTPGLLEGQTSEAYLPIAGHYLYFHPHDEQVKYELKRPKSDILIKTRFLPLIPFIQKWDRMTYRLIRLKAYFTDTEDKVKEWESWGYGTEKWKRVTGVDKINAIMHGDIADILTSCKYR